MANLIITGLDNASGRKQEAQSGDLIVDVDGNLVLAGGVEVFSETTGIDGTATGVTNLYTVPSGTQIVITEVVVRVTNADTVTGVPSLGIGIAAGEDDIVSSQSLVGLSATGDVFTLDVSAKSVIANAADVIKVGIDTGGTGTTLTLAIDLIGYVVGATSIQSSTSSGATLCNMYLSANQATNTGLDQVDIDATDYDPFGIADTVNFRMVIPAAFDGRRCIARGYAVWNASPSWSTSDSIQIRIKHQNSGGTDITFGLNTAVPCTDFPPSLVGFTPAFTVSTGDRIELHAASADFVGGREFAGGAGAAGFRCWLELVLA